MIGQRIGTYRIVRELGSGGMGSVYEAVHESSGQRVAIKLLLREHSTDPHVVTRFFGEARTASIINHPGLVHIHEHGVTPDGQAYLVMEFLDGQTLRRRLTDGPPLLSASLPVIQQAAQALAATHAKQIVHRDLKPDNLMLLPDAAAPGGMRVKLLDFGIAKIQDGAEGETTSQKTQSGTLVGTPTYMSPEQCRGQAQIDGQSDVYSLGVIFYELLAGAPPFRAEALPDMLALHLYVTPRPLRDSLPQLPANLDTLIRRMLAKKPEERPTAAYLAAQLEAMHVTDDELTRCEDSDDRTQGALSEQDIRALTSVDGLAGDDRSVSMHGATATPTPAPRVGERRRRAWWRSSALQVALGVILLGGGAAYLVHRSRARVVDPSKATAVRIRQDAPSGLIDSGTHTTQPADRKSADDRAPDHTSSPTQGSDLAALATSLRAELEPLRPDKALRKLKPVLKEHPQSVDLLELKCELQVKAGKHRRAIRSCGKALHLDPDRASVRALLQSAKQKAASSSEDDSDDESSTSESSSDK